MTHGVPIELFGDEVESWRRLILIFDGEAEVHATADLSEDALRDETGNAQAEPWIRSRRNCPGGKLNSRSKAVLSRHSAFISAFMLIWR